MKLPNALQSAFRHYFQHKGLTEFNDDWWEAFRANPRIIKHYWSWLRLRDGQTNTLVEGLPWYTFAAIDWLEDYLRPDMKVFEWGSGGSTIYYARKAKQVISIEHDKAWHGDVAAKVRKDRLKNATVKLIEPAKSSIRLSSNLPGDYRSTNKSMESLDYKTYNINIRQYDDASFNLVAIDGRARTSCVLEAIPKVKPGGYILLDNSDRVRYEAGTILMKGWKRTDFAGPLPYIDDFLRTSIFRKP